MPRSSGAGSTGSHYDEVLARTGATYGALLEELAEYNQMLARLVQARVARPWTDFEHDAYVRLRGVRVDLNRRTMHVARAFELARLQRRELGESN